MCRAEIGEVIISTKKDAVFEDFTLGGLYPDRALQFYFEDPMLCGTLQHIRGIFCPICHRVSQGKDRKTFNSLPELKRHMKDKHGRALCMVCIHHESLFLDEHRIFGVAELQRHQKK